MKSQNANKNTGKKRISHRNRGNQKGANNLRIIGGEWRSRKLPFIDAPGLRPTPGRIRETLFNWLQGEIRGARCLDLFAGTGALGFEALSRGAENLVFVEKNPVVVTQLKNNLNLLNSDSAVIQADALELLAIHSENPPSTFSLFFENAPYDIVFLDPPYRKGLQSKALKALLKSELLTKNVLIYLEHEAEESMDWNSLNVSVFKEAKAGQVKSFLLEKR